jgi:hypothetical protein
MSFMIELYYKAPADADKEIDLVTRVKKLGGRLDFREEPEPDASRSVCLTFEFNSLSQAKAAAEQLRRDGEHVEGPAEYAAD